MNEVIYEVSADFLSTRSLSTQHMAMLIAPSTLGGATQEELAETLSKYFAKVTKELKDYDVDVQVMANEMRFWGGVNHKDEKNPDVPYQLAQAPMGTKEECLELLKSNMDDVVAQIKEWAKKEKPVF